MKKLVFVTIVTLALMSGTALAVDKDLIAGQWYDIGTVRVTNDGTNLYVEYILDGPCEVWGDLAETHLHVSTAAPVAGAAIEPKIPQNNKGNPQIGNFDWSGAMSFTIPFSSIGPGTAGIGVTLYIAAHAAGPGWEELAAILPDEVSLDILGYGLTQPYLDIMISGDGVLNGPHTAWCLDVYTEVTLDYGIFSDIISPEVVAPEINWLINNWMDYIGEMSDQGDPYVPGDIQAAIWLLTSGMPDYNLADPNFSQWAWGLYNWGDWTDHDHGVITPPDPGDRDEYDADEYNDDVARAQEIADDALLYGAGFLPGCCEVTGVVLIPYIGTDQMQPLLITVPAPCDETAWAQGTQFPIKGNGNGSWAMYFTYIPVAP